MFGSDSSKAEKYYEKARRSYGGKAELYYQKAAELGHIPSMSHVGSILVTNGDDDSFKNGVNYLQRAAKGNDVNAVVTLSKVIITNISRFSIDEAIGCCFKAADVGYNDSLKQLSNILLDSNDERSIKCLERLADSGDPESCLYLGNIYHSGIMTDASESEAFKWFLMGAELNQISCIINVGSCYFNGVSVEKDIKQAVHWYMVGAQLGDPDCMYNVASIRSMFSDMFPDSASENIDLLTRASNSGHLDSMALLGSTLYKIRERSWEGSKLLTDAIERGSGLAALYYGDEQASLRNGNASKYYAIAVERHVLEAYHKLALIYTTRPHSFNKAFSIANEGYSLGSKECSLPLGICYLYGKGTDRDYEKAYNLIVEAVSLDMPCAYLYLGNFYFRGIIVEQSYSKAFELYSLSYSKGCFWASTYLGICHYGGFGTEKSEKQAVEYFHDYKDGVCDSDFYLYFFVFRSIEFSRNFGHHEYYEEPITLYYRGIALSIYFSGHSYDYDWIRQSADLGCPEALNAMGDYYSKPNNFNFDRAVDYYRKAIDRGFLQSQSKLGNLYMKNNDFDSAICCFVSYYDKIDKNNAFNLRSSIPFSKICKSYYDGEGISQSYEKAFLWAKRGSEADDLGSLFVLGLCYLYGHGVSQSFQKSRELFQSVVDRFSYVKGQEFFVYNSYYLLGEIYYYGRGVERSVYKAATYLLVESQYTTQSDALLSKCVVEGNLIVNGSYKEKLKIGGGILVVTKEEWHITYYVPGPDRKTVPVPDLRYKGHYDYVPGDHIDEYIRAWRANLQDYYDLMRGKMPGTNRTTGQLGMTITVSRYGGVSLSPDSRLKINTDSMMDALIQDFEYAKSIAPGIQSRILDRPRPLYFN